MVVDFWKKYTLHNHDIEHLFIYFDVNKKSCKLIIHTSC